MKLRVSLILLVVILLPFSAFAQNSTETNPILDSDNDGLTDLDEKTIYNTDVANSDTDSDGYLDGDEIKFGFDPNKNHNDKLDKSIVVVLADQSLSYRLGNYVIDSFKISSGLPKTPTPTGDYKIEIKKPVVNYIGLDYSYKNTKWNMLFKKSAKGNLYIHGAFWHNSFGKPMSHGCINVSYQNMEKLYNWADTGTKLTIK